MPLICTYSTPASAKELGSLLISEGWNILYGRDAKHLSIADKRFYLHNAHSTEQGCSDHIFPRFG